MTAGNQRDTEDAICVSRRLVAERPPRSLMLAALGLFVSPAVPWIIILGTALQGEFIFAVCLVFSIVALGICSVTVRQALRARPNRCRTVEYASGARTGGQWLATHSGALPMRAAAVQILLLPGSLAVGFTVFAVIDAIIRT